jgi:hypothetical protein
MQKLGPDFSNGAQCLRRRNTQGSEKSVMVVVCSCKGRKAGSKPEIGRLGGDDMASCKSG